MSLQKDRSQHVFVFNIKRDWGYSLGGVCGIFGSIIILTAVVALSQLGGQRIPLKEGDTLPSRYMTMFGLK